jgi:hypothetical protein
MDECWNSGLTISQSQSQSHFTADSQYVLVSSPFWDFD